MEYSGTRHHIFKYECALLSSRGWVQKGAACQQVCINDLEKKNPTTLKCYWIGSWLHLLFIYTLLLYCNSSITPVWMRTESERKKRNKLINQTHFFLQNPPRAVSRWPSWTPGSASWPSARPETNLQHPKQCESMKSLLRHTQESFRTSMISHYHKSAF